MVGDLNVGHTELDIKNWKGNVKRAGFLPEERAYFDRFFGDEIGWRDVHRGLAGDVDGPYTWWSWRGQAFDNDTGWRIDYHMATPTRWPAWQPRPWSTGRHLGRPLLRPRPAGRGLPVLESTPHEHRNHRTDPHRHGGQRGSARCRRRLRATGCSPACSRRPTRCTWATTWARWSTGSGMQDEYDAVFFIPDLHAITVRHDPRSWPSAPGSPRAQYIAGGIDIERSPRCSSSPTCPSTPSWPGC